ncbi:GNAT family N-acetyltransferase [Paenibacillus oenotherae]|uniref:GNAT family N-acetyltransferase n=1 Tax=Paenibacillus oenotherae TaxID=1435645 RepID=A0ABS7D2G3_9BACL|nr:GNAT family N-acetyltransferase [Paenibacillus oenotherae]MBW7474043.1 GNAT family N-acetyltransferase [Paenibacillus oenotherae]
MYTINILTKADWTAYRNLMFQWIMPQLDGLHALDRLLMVGMESAEGPVGLAVLELDPDERCATVHCLFVAAAHRRRGLAARLMGTARLHCAKRNIASMKFAYYSGKAITPAVEAWLHKEGWTEPQREAVVFHIDSTIAGAPWLRDRPLPHGLHMLPWIDIDQEDREQLAAGRTHAYPAFLSPFKTFAQLEQTNSLGLMSASGIEGWCMAYRLAAETILYDAVFVSPQYQQSGLALVMLSRSISLQLEKGIPFGMFTVNTSTPAMMKLARQWLAPYARMMSEKRSCYLQLT